MKHAVAKVINSDDGQVIVLPDEFRIDTDEVLITQSGDRGILTPRVSSWEGFVEGLSGLSNDFAVTGGLAADTPRKTLE